MSPVRIVGNIDQMMERTMATRLSCPRCGHVFTFQEGAFRARDAGIPEQVVVCTRCQAVFELDVQPSGVRLTNDVTARYGPLPTAASPASVGPGHSISANEALRGFTHSLIGTGASSRRVSRGGLVAVCVSLVLAAVAFAANPEARMQNGFVYVSAAACTLAWSVLPNRRRITGVLVWFGGLLLGGVVGLLLTSGAAAR